MNGHGMIKKGWRTQNYISLSLSRLVRLDSHVFLKQTIIEYDKRIVAEANVVSNANSMPGQNNVVTCNIYISN